ncbi:MAG: 3-isopropylmalate dehydrogenase [Blastocatellia bacterium]|nr:3-isopropylmalate dehydrogenase [Blastocatellia bacterium]MBK6425754.1 3-isopropylmalate dehydrogenase [Blastocatellia bacterium]
MRIAIIPGDGIGKEVIAEAVRVVEAAETAFGFSIEKTAFDWGADRYLCDGTSLPDGAVEMFQNEYDAILLGAVGDPRVPDNRHAADILLGLRFKLDLYVNLRPVKLLADSLTPLKGRTCADIDFVVLRENTEGLYTFMGGIFKKGTPDEIAIQEEVNTRKGVERIIEAAFDLAERTGRRKVTLADKSNAMTYGHDLWRRAFKEVGERHPTIETNAQYIDATAMFMVLDPGQYDVIVTNNLFGDIITDLGAALQGGLGVAGSGNINPGRVSLFEPVHGSAPQFAGKNVANPIGSVLAAGLMLEHLGQKSAADAIERAVVEAINDGKLTKDVGGSLSTTEAGAAIAARVRA